MAAKAVAASGGTLVLDSVGEDDTWIGFWATYHRAVDQCDYPRLQRLVARLARDAGEKQLL